MNGQAGESWKKEGPTYSPQDMSVNSRLSTLESDYKHLATKTEIANLKTDIARIEGGMMTKNQVIGGLIIICITLISSLVNIGIVLLKLK